VRPLDITACPLDGVRVIEASAGTGKTHAITGLYLRLLLERALTVDSLLVVTYTVAAAEELRERIRARLRDAHAMLARRLPPDPADALMAALAARYADSEGARIALEVAYHDLDKAAIHTIHGFCRLVLSENAFESGSLFDTGLVADRSDLLAAVAADYWRTSFYNLPGPIARELARRSRGPGHFAQLYRLRPLDRSFDILPRVDAPDHADIVDTLSKLDAAFAELRSAWERDSDGVRELLAGAPGLNRQKYQARHLESWYAQLDAFCAAGDGRGECDPLVRFSRRVIAGAMRQGHDAPEHEFFVRCEELLALREAADGLLERFFRRHEAAFFAYADRELARRMASRNERSFDDIITDTHAAVTGGGGLAAAVRARFRAALIDEYQDTDQVQYDIFRAAFDAPGSALFLIGDPKQSIYRFRGADVFSFIRAKRDAGGDDAAFTLLANRRSDPALIRAVNAIFSRVANPFVIDGIGFSPAEAGENPRREAMTLGGRPGAAFEFWSLDDPEERGTVPRGRALPMLGRAVATEIVRLLDDGAPDAARIGTRPVRPGDIAILVHSNAHARVMRDHLTAFGVPGVLYGAESVFSTREALELMRCLMAIALPGPEHRFRAALSTDMIGLSGPDLFGLAEDEARWERFARAFSRARERWMRDGFYCAIRAFMDELEVRPRLLAFPDGERRLTNLIHLAELGHGAERDRHLRPEGVVAWLGARIVSPGTDDAQQLRLETDDAAVKILTVHGSKGLQFPIVFCPCLWRASDIKPGKPYLYRDPKDFSPTVDLGSGDDAVRRRAEREVLSENVRLLYVALTRAIHRCYFAWGNIKGAETAAPSYLLYAPDELDPADCVGALEGHVKSLPAGERASFRSALAERSGGAIVVRPVPHENAPPLRAATAPPGGIVPRPFTGSIGAHWTVTSYSALAASGRESGERPDYDAHFAPFEPDAAPVAFDDIARFPRGARPGQCIHEMFERVDFTDETGFEGVIDAALARHGIDAAWSAACSTMLARVCAAPLGDDGVSLRTVGRERRLSELEYYFPLSAVEPAGVAEAFAVHAANPVVRNFSSAAAGLGFAGIRGFVRGFIDLVVEHAGRYSIIDWKSNWLGDAPAAYTPDALAADMVRHAYVLQYHLYAVALHRYLSLRLPGYEYDRNFGGVRYVYVRGVDPSGAPGCGVFADRPPRALIEALTRYLTRGDGDGVA